MNTNLSKPQEILKGMLQSLESQRFRQNLATEQRQHHILRGTKGLCTWSVAIVPGAEFVILSVHRPLVPLGSCLANEANGSWNAVQTPLEKLRNPWALELGSINPARFSVYLPTYTPNRQFLFLQFPWGNCTRLGPYNGSAWVLFSASSFIRTLELTHIFAYPSWNSSYRISGSLLGPHFYSL